MTHAYPAMVSVRPAARTTSLVIRIAFLIAAVACAFPCPARATTVSGRVTNHLTGQPLGGTQITIWYWASIVTGRTIGTATTAADGSYSWSGECPVQDQRVCYVTVDDERYLYAISEFRYDQTDVAADFALIQAATIAGELRLDGAVPADELEVRVSYYLEEEQIWQSPIGAFQEYEDGRYAIRRLPPNVPYRLCVGGFDIAGTVALEQCFDRHDRTSLADDPSYDPVTVGEGQQRDGVDFDLSGGGGIEGTLRDGYLGVPIANANFSMSFYGQTGAWLGVVAQGMSDGDGRYRFKGLPDGAYYVRIHGAGYFVDDTQTYPGVVCEEGNCPPVTDGQLLRIADAALLSGIDFTFHPIAVVRGRVTEATTGRGLAGVFVIATGTTTTFTRDNGEFALYVPDTVAPFEVYTDGAPQPFVDQLYPGMPCIEHRCSGAGQTFNPARGEVIDHVDLTLQPGAAIAGTLFNAATGLPQKAGVLVYDQDFNLVWSGIFEGPYSSRAWLPGTYYVQAIAYGDGLTPTGCAFYEGRPCPADGEDPASVVPTPITAGAGEIRDGIDFRLNGDSVFRDGFEPAVARERR